MFFIIPPGLSVTARGLLFFYRFFFRITFLFPFSLLHSALKEQPEHPEQAGFFLSRYTTNTALIQISPSIRRMIRSPADITFLPQRIPKKVYIKPIRFPISRTRSAAVQAMIHCHSTTPTAHLAPISLRIEATAATQGV